MIKDELIPKYGYPYERHSVTTQDGYILSLDRVPHSRNSSKLGEAVLVNHGIGSDAASFFLITDENSLGFLLADAGYDVWLLNMRGTTNSKKHVWLDLHDDRSKFWDFR